MGIWQDFVWLRSIGLVRISLVKFSSMSRFARVTKRSHWMEMTT